MDPAAGTTSPEVGRRAGLTRHASTNLTSLGLGWRRVGQMPWFDDIHRMLLLLALGLATGAAAQVELAPDVQADRLFLRAERHLAAEEYYSALGALDGLLRLQAAHELELPEAFWFRHAVASLNAGDHQQAAESVTQYLQTAGRQGKHYLAALELLDNAEEEARTVEVQRRRLESQAAAELARQRRNVEQSRRQIDLAAAALPRDQLTSGGHAPEMIRVASGEFEYSAFRDGFGGVHPVTLADPFDISRYEVTRVQYQRFVEGARYKTDGERRPMYGCGGNVPDARERSGRTWRRPGFGQTDTHPVVCVSIRDAIAFAKWLSDETGRVYRLPSAVEWQYAARAGSKTSLLFADGFGLDDEAPCAFGNVNDARAKHLLDIDNADCDDGYVGTAPVGQFRANDIGIHDMFGNVAEFVMNCTASPTTPTLVAQDPTSCQPLGLFGSDGHGDGGQLVPQWFGRLRQEHGCLREEGYPACVQQNNLLPEEQRVASRLPRREGVEVALSYLDRRPCGEGVRQPFGGREAQLIDEPWPCWCPRR